MATLPNFENIFLHRQGGLIAWLAAFLLLTPANGKQGLVPNISFSMQLKAFIASIEIIYLDELHIAPKFTLSMFISLISNEFRWKKNHDNYL